ncbi:3-ketoacyl-ACP reductase [Catellatospora sp. TT07R-123]|uniref:SDR family oxidoreductase n=1 Tax=Catellatospora sp. TT07R-123 TaxID=2733863 RepID=UPI001B183C7C|nr:SDR family oxidoreductase [Catellatospora sp. TT07R-123]GHJ49252.1 3-ketoacyl-ACP reductase [Catellatospora sp. TT07R-123]
MSNHDTYRPVALVTGVGRTANIGAAVVRRLAADGYRVFATGLPRYDASVGVPGDDPAALAAELGPDVHVQPHDLGTPDGPAELVAAVVERFGGVDTLVSCHTYSTSTTLGSLEADEIDRHLTVNVRANMLLVQAYAAAHDDARPGRIVLFTSGQRHGPMTTELAYAASKAAVEYLTRDFSALLAGRGITVNAVNPGPNDTGWADPQTYEWVRERFPRKRWGTPHDTAKLVGFLCSDEAEWVTAQVIDSAGGFGEHVA